VPFNYTFWNFKKKDIIKLGALLKLVSTKTSLLQIETKPLISLLPSLSPATRTQRSSVAPARTEASLVGAPGKRWWRAGVGPSSVDSRLQFGPVVASWSRLPDLLG
jgi:hypothetical protein